MCSPAQQFIDFVDKDSNADFFDFAATQPLNITPVSRGLSKSHDLSECSDSDDPQTVEEDALESTLSLSSDPAENAALDPTLLIDPDDNRRVVSDYQHIPSDDTQQVYMSTMPEFPRTVRKRVNLKRSLQSTSIPARPLFPARLPNPQPVDRSLLQQLEGVTMTVSTSGIIESKSFMKHMKALGWRVDQALESVVNGSVHAVFVSEIKKTPKILSALALGIPLLNYSSFRDISKFHAFEAKNVWSSTMLQVAITLKETTQLDHCLYIQRCVRSTIACKLDTYLIKTKLPAPSPYATPTAHRTALFSLDPLLVNGPTFAVAHDLQRPLAHQAIFLLQTLGCSNYHIVNLNQKKMKFKDSTYLLSDAPHLDFLARSQHNYKGDLLFDLILCLDSTDSTQGNPLWDTHRHANN